MLSDNIVTFCELQSTHNVVLSDLYVHCDKTVHITRLIAVDTSVYITLVYIFFIRI